MRGPNTWEASDMSSQDKGRHGAGHWGTGSVRQLGSVVDMAEGVSCHRV